MAIFDTTPYRNYDVLVMTPNEIQNGDQNFARMLEEHDNRVSLPQIIDTAEESFPTTKFSWLLASRLEKIEFYQFIYRVRGRQKLMWVPSYKNDMTLLADVAADVATLTIKNIGLSKIGLGDRQRHIRFAFIDGTFLYRRIESAAFVNSKQETITLDRGFYSGLSRSSIEMISFMTLARLDNDTIEIRHQTDMDGVATSATLFRTTWDIRDV